jgi:predicted PurR-regulated permease PerM
VHTPQTARPSQIQPQRVVLFRSRTVLQVAGLLLGVAITLWVIWISHRVLTWVAVAAFLALALDPAVRALEKRGLGRGAAVAVIFVTAIALLSLLGALLIPPLVDQVQGLVDATPGYVEDVTAGRGPLGFLERDYHIVERVREATADQGSPDLVDGAGTVVAVGRSIITGVVAVVTILFLTLFMVLEGPKWTERAYALMTPESQTRWRAVGHRIAQTISGYVTGNLLISLIAGLASTIILVILGVPFALALGLTVAVLDLIPLAGATLAAILLVTVGFLTSVTAGIVLLVFFVLYQQLENHILQPLVYGRTVQLSPLVVLIAILVGTEVAGILGALGAIPIAGTIQILLLDWLAHRPRRNATSTEPIEVPGDPAPS